MSEKDPVGKHGESSARHRPTHESVDIRRILDDWQFEPGAINVRKITGTDGRAKIQMRVDLGLLQMEISGRPDGSRPHGHESLLDYFEGLLETHRHKHGSDEGFHLTSAQCQSLRDEAYMYYQRYISFFALGELAAVARDTDRNLRVLDLCGQYASDEQDRLFMEQYRPYIIMMNAKARAAIRLKNGNYPRALAIVQDGLRAIKRFFHKFNQDDAYKRCHEARALKRLRREIRDKMPVDPREKLQRDLDRAVKDERYEDAARLRDELSKLLSSE